MRKLSALVLSLVALSALVLTGCGSVEPTAVTVNGTKISQDTVDEELRQIRDNDDYREALSLGNIEGSGKDGTFNAEFAAQVVTLDIYYELVEQELERRDIELTEKDLERGAELAEQNLSVNPQTGQQEPGLGKKVLAGFSEDYRETLIRREALVAKLQEALSDTEITDESVRDYFDENQAEFTEVCAKHVLVDSKEAADQVVAELGGGADFAAVAKAKSKDPSAQQNSGDLGCEPAATYVEEFRDATLSQPLNAVGAPVQTQFGYHVIVVTQRTAQEFADVEEQIRQRLASQDSDAVGTWLTDALKKAKISVNPRFGKFEREPEDGRLPRVVPPAAARTTTSASPGTSTP